MRRSSIRAGHKVLCKGYVQPLTVVQIVTHADERGFLAHHAHHAGVSNIIIWHPLSDCTAVLKELKE